MRAFRPMPQECIIDTRISMYQDDSGEDVQYLAFYSWEEYFSDKETWSTEPEEELKTWIKEQAIERPHGPRHWCHKIKDAAKGAVYEDSIGNEFFVPNFGSLSWSWATQITEVY